MSDDPGRLVAHKAQAKCQNDAAHRADACGLITAPSALGEIRKMTDAAVKQCTDNVGDTDDYDNGYRCALADLSARFRADVEPLVDRLQQQLSVSEIGRQALAADLETLVKAILPDDEKRLNPMWTITNLAALAGAHRSDSLAIDDTGWAETDQLDQAVASIGGQLRRERDEAQREHAALTEERDLRKAQAQAWFEKWQIRLAERDALRAAIEQVFARHSGFDVSAPVTGTELALRACRCGTCDFLNEQLAALLPAAPPTPTEK